MKAETKEIDDDELLSPGELRVYRTVVGIKVHCSNWRRGGEHAANTVCRKDPASTRVDFRRLKRLVLYFTHMKDVTKRMLPTTAEPTVLCWVDSE